MQLLSVYASLVVLSPRECTQSMAVVERRVAQRRRHTDRDMIVKGATWKATKSRFKSQLLSCH